MAFRACTEIEVPPGASVASRVGADVAGQDELLVRVREEILESLPAGTCNRDNVASKLAMGPTTLQLRLSERGTSFLEQVDATRRQLALAYVRQPALPLAEISSLLGFSDTPTFTRAFKRWQGMSPASYRAGFEPVACHLP